MTRHSSATINDQEQVWGMGQTRQHGSKKGGKTDKEREDHKDCKHRRKRDTGENKDNQKRRENKTAQEIQRQI